MKYLQIALVAVVVGLASPALALTAHGVVYKGLKVATYPVRHPLKTAKAPVKGVVYVVKHI